MPLRTRVSVMVGGNSGDKSEVHKSVKASGDGIKDTRDGQMAFQGYGRPKSENSRQGTYFKEFLQGAVLSVMV